MNSTPETIVAYVASPHDGYLRFFRDHRGAALYVLGKELIEPFAPLKRHLPGNDPEDAAKMIAALGIFSEVRVLTLANLEEIRDRELVMPDEDVSHAVAKQYLPATSIRFDGSWRLRWHWDAIMKARPPEIEQIISSDALHQKLMRKAYDLAGKSSDWWRQIGSLLVWNGEVMLAAFNKHRPSEQSPYLLGDPRSYFEAGQHIDMSSAGHGERSLIAKAAARGIKTAGCDLFVTTFPCPPCAYEIADAQIGRLFYAEGYSRIEGGAELARAGVQIIKVNLDPPSS